MFTTDTWRNFISHYAKRSDPPEYTGKKSKKFTIKVYASNLWFSICLVFKNYLDYLRFIFISNKLDYLSVLFFENILI